jgi:hypothetical protein
MARRGNTRLLEDLLTRPDVQHLMLIAAYRGNEVNSAHPLMRKGAAHLVLGWRSEWVA